MAATMVLVGFYPSGRCVLFVAATILTVVVWIDVVVVRTLVVTKGQFIPKPGWSFFG